MFPAGNAMERAMEYPDIKKFFADFFRSALGVTSANFVDGKSGSDMASGVTEHQEHSPFVLVAHCASGQWEVYANDFEHPLASFGERQAGCDFATDLARNRENTIVLIRELQSLR